MSGTTVIGDYSTYNLQQLLFTAGAVALIFLSFAFFLLYQRWKNRKYLMMRIRREWGQIPEREYDPTEFANISRYYVNRETEEFQIDDITWNDLDMDRIFMKLNHTRSFLGENYLYYQLRTPQMKKEKLEEFEYLVSWFGSHTKERENLEYFFAKVGKTGRNSVFDYIYNLKNVTCQSNLIHFAMIAFVLVSIGVLLVNPQPGILLLFTSIGISIGTYEHYKRPIAPYVASCIAIEKVLVAAEGILKEEVVGLNKDRIKKAAASFGRLRRNMALLVAGEGRSDDMLGMIFVYLNSILHIDIIQFRTVVKEIGNHINEFTYLVEEIGRLESAIAVASFRESYPGHAIPEFIETKKICFHTEDMYHPLIAEPVCNSIDMMQSVLLTGANASGKSTFIKTASLQIILAQTIHTVTASSYHAGFFRVYTSMALRDDLVGEESYYMVEIRSLKRILDRVSGEVPVFCCVDEVLRGTNTVERIAASAQILKWMAEHRLLCMAATHDIELTYLLDGIYRNYHFEEEVTDREIRFDYKLKKGRAMTRNAIRLLDLMGFEKEIMKSAEEMAEKLSERGLEYQKITVV